MQRVALIGAGVMGSAHANCYSQMTNANLVAVLDIRPEVASEMATKLGAEAFSDAETLFREAEFDAIDVCVPTPWHTEYVKMAAAAGKHVCCEKPFGRSVEECKEAAKACDKAGVTLFIAHVVRWFPEYRKANELVRSGEIGAPAVVRTFRGGGGFPHGWNDWYANPEWSGGVCLDLIIHDFDWLLATIGPADRVFAKGLLGSGLKDKDHAMVTIRFKNGVIGQVEGSWAVPGDFRYSFEVTGDKGLLSFSSAESGGLIAQRWPSDESPEAVVLPTEASPYLQELQHFINCLETGAKPEVTPKEATAAVAVSLAAIESIKTGLPVKV